MASVEEEERERYAIQQTVLGQCAYQKKEDRGVLHGLTVIIKLNGTVQSIVSREKKT